MQGKVACTEYSTWDAGQHFMLIQYMMPGLPRIQLAYIHLDRDKTGKPIYRVKDKNKNEIMNPFDSMVPLKKYFKENGYELAMKNKTNQTT